MTKVLIAGGGRVGSALAWFLSRHPDAVYELSVVDPYPIQNELPEGTKVIQANPFSVPEVVAGSDYFVNTAATYEAASLLGVLISCLQHGVHYFDITEDVDMGKSAYQIGTAQTAIMVAPHCGLAPGLINILVGGLLRKMTNSNVTPVNVDMRVGALPRSVSNAYQYLSTWSTQGLVNEYLNDAPILEGGFHKSVNVFRNHEDSIYRSDLYIDGIEYESFPTSGGCSTMLSAETLAQYPSLMNIIYRSIRYPGHFLEVEEVIRGEMFNRDSIAKILDRECRFEGFVEDRVLIYVNVKGLTKDSKPVQAGRVLVAQAAMPFTALQRTTAGSLAVVLDMHRQGQLAPTGYLRQETIDVDKFFANPLATNLGIA